MHSSISSLLSRIIFRFRVRFHQCVTYCTRTERNIDRKLKKKTYDALHLLTQICVHSGPAHTLKEQNRCELLGSSRSGSETKKSACKVIDMRARRSVDDYTRDRTKMQKRDRRCSVYLCTEQNSSLHAFVSHLISIYYHLRSLFTLSAWFGERKKIKISIILLFISCARNFRFQLSTNHYRQTRIATKNYGIKTSSSSRELVLTTGLR